MIRLTLLMLVLTMASTGNCAPNPQASATVSGRVVDEAGKPLVKVHLYLESRTKGGGYNAATPQAQTDSKGHFTIVTSDPADCVDINVSSPRLGLEGTYKLLTLKAGDSVEANFTLFTSKTVTLDFVFQPDGTRGFASGVKTGTIKCERPNFGFLFAKGTAHATSQPDDLRLECRNGEWFFRNFHVNGKSGFYDVGLVPFATVTEAAESGYGTAQKPCTVGHSYVVRTLDGHFAKFIVRSIRNK